MGDFHQNGIITTLHNLARRPVEELERELVSFKKPTYVVGFAVLIF